MKTQGCWIFADLPSFAEPIGNVTAAIGKEAVLPCTIRKLGNHKVRDTRRERGGSEREREREREIFARSVTARQMGHVDAHGRCRAVFPPPLSPIASSFFSSPSSSSYSNGFSAWKEQRTYEFSLDETGRNFSSPN